MVHISIQAAMSSSQAYEDPAVPNVDDMTDTAGHDSLVDELVMMPPHPSTTGANEEIIEAAAAAATTHHHNHNGSEDVATTAAADHAMLLDSSAEDVMLPPSLPPPVDNHNNMLQQPPVPIRPSPEGILTKPKSTRINWGKSPHRERLAQILHDWFSSTGLRIDPTTSQPIADYRVYAAKVGISRTTLYKYIHADVSKRRLLKSEEEGSGRRGKKRLMSLGDVKRIVEELKEGKDDNTPPSRNEAVDLIVKRFGLSRQAASRQLTRHVMPMFHSKEYQEEGPNLLGDNKNSGHLDAADDGGGKQLAVAAAAEDASQQQQQVAAAAATVDITMAETTQQQDIHQTKRSIVISGVTSGLGRALLGYYYNHGHTVSGCGRRQSEVQALQALYPNANLYVVDVANDDSVQVWAESICVRTKGVVDLVIANAGISPETSHQTKCAWEVPRQDFDNTLDVNIKGVSNMIRHFVPLMIKNNTGTFVAMSSGLGRSPNPNHVAYCASKWAVEGMVKSLAMSLPEDGNMCAVPLAPGVVQSGVQPGGEGKNVEGGGGNVEKWIEEAGPMILGLSKKDNGKSLSVKGFYSVRYRQSWSFPDGSGIPDRVGHVF